jgi:uncharacterized lipoprotein NlpE involved in copper resistance
MLTIRRMILVLWTLVACSNQDTREGQPSAPPPSAGAKPAASATGVAGTWVTDAGATKLVLERDGTFVMDTKKGQHVTGTYALDGTSLKMTGGGEGAISGTFSGSLVGSTIELKFGPRTAVFERQP